MIKKLPPLSLYIHIPWCVRKCPYCDFNSHESQKELPVQDYVNALREDLTIEQPLAQGRRITSIFFGGGTPSLFPGSAIGEIINTVDELIGIEKNAEITLEANPGATECLSFQALHEAGVNRLSMGVQSFNDTHLKKLGRIHNSKHVFTAFERARTAGFNNINIDLMHGLPNQTQEQALSDLHKAIELKCTHISWYQLTIEPNTAFYSEPPLLPVEDTLANIQERGQSLLEHSGFVQYEVSAFAAQSTVQHLPSQGTVSKKPQDWRSQHNLNYWRFGDYLGIGAGAHGKITQLSNHPFIIRRQKTRQPKDYLDAKKTFASKQSTIDKQSLSLEFFMNGLRLNTGIEKTLFEERTGLNIALLKSKLTDLEQKGLIVNTKKSIALSELGRRYLNSVLEYFV